MPNRGTHTIRLTLLLALTLAACQATPTPPTASPRPPAMPTAIRITAEPPPTRPPLPAPTLPGEIGWSMRFAEAIMARWPNANDIVGHGWEYNTGIVLYGLAAVQRRQAAPRDRDPRLLAYIQHWVDGYVGPQGEFTLPESDNLDLVQPANLLLYLYEATGEMRYLTAARTIADDLLANHPRNAAGGFWHKDIYPNQMWLDGVYMAGPFLARLSALTGEPGYADTAAEQALLVAAHTQDPASDLLRHAWDASGAAAWAEPATGQSPLVWSRAMGWYAMALVDMLTALPADHPGRDALLDVLQRAAAGLAATQDPATGLWFQVLDQPELPGNWIETSGSAMIVYALQAGVDAGLLDGRYAAVAGRGWQGLQAMVSLGPDGAPVVCGAVEGMGVQADAAAYLGKQRLENSPHGLVSILLASSVMERAGPVP
jgi:unsaturated rhamnogalacturonyl hydrolase